MKLYLIGLVELVRPLAKIKYANEPRKKKKKIKQKRSKGKAKKPTYNIKPKLRNRAIYNL